MLLGLHNPEEFSLTSDEETPEQIMQRTEHQVRNQKRLDSLKKKLHTDDECMYDNKSYTYYPARMRKG